MKGLKPLLLAAALFMALTPLTSYAASSNDQTSKYRVYQNANLLKEFSSKAQAIAYARYFENSYVEDIETRQWQWSQFSNFLIQTEQGTLSKAYASLDAAVAVARTMPHAAVRNKESIGWAWHNYPRYQLYQGDKTLPAWEFDDLGKAKEEARKWGNAHIIDLKTNYWIWDNLTEDMEEQWRSRAPIYQVYVPGAATEPDSEFSSDHDVAGSYSFLRDAVGKAVLVGDAVVKNTETDKIVYSSIKKVKVYQNVKELAAFFHIDDAISYAKQWAHARITIDDVEVWNNFPYYQVWKNGTKRVEYTSLSATLKTAMSVTQGVVKSYDGTTIWDNSTRLQVWAWNGSSKDEQIRQQISQTIGLDVDSPTWFELQAADGSIKDTSSPEMVRWLHSQGLQVYPLVHNQFSSSLTTKFLADPAAQKRFITTLIERSAKLGVDGINLDFESLSGSDRSKFSAFFIALTEAAHAKHLKVSIDLPRGSIAWNDKTAFDHAVIARHADYIMIMAYDQYWSGSTSPGSVSGLDWTEKGIQEFLSYGVSRDQLILGVPLYSRLWKVTASGTLVSNRSLLNKDVDALLQDKQFTKTYDPTFGQYRIEYMEDGHKYVFWREDHETLKARIALAKEYRLGGIAAWRLGHEPAYIWQTVVEEK